MTPRAATTPTRFVTSRESRRQLLAAANLCEDSSLHRSQQFSRFTQQVLNPPSFGDRLRSEQAVLARVLISPRRAGPRRSTVHAAALLPRTAGERHAPPARILAPQRGLASIGPVLRA